MKRSDLKVGKAYLWGRGNDWRKYPSSNRKVTVLSLEKVGTPQSWGSRRMEFTLPDGSTVNAVADRYGTNGVLVDDDGHARVVPTGQLRGPWETANAEALETRTRIDAKRAEVARERRERTASLKALGDRIAALTGHPDVHLGEVGVSRVTITEDVLEALVEAASNPFGDSPDVIRVSPEQFKRMEES